MRSTAAQPIRLLDGGLHADCRAGSGSLRWAPREALDPDPANAHLRTALLNEELGKALDAGLDSVLQVTMREGRPFVLEVPGFPPGRPGDRLVEISVVAVRMIRVEAKGDPEVVDRLLQLHYHELALGRRHDVDEVGQYRTPDRTADSTRWLIRDASELIGFAIVLEDDPSMLEEFFVLPGFRRWGLGRGLARVLFRMRPGDWRLHVEHGNDVGAAFCAQVMNDLPDARVEPGSGADTWTFHSP